MGNKKSQHTVSVDLTPQEIIMLRSNTNVSESEIREWYKDFIRRSPNGRVTKAQFRDLYTQLYPAGHVDEYITYAFNVFDTNHSGTIDFEEFLLSMAVTSDGKLENRLSVAFDIYDIEEEGHLDQNDLVGLLTAMYDLAGENDRHGNRAPKTRADQIVSRLDVYDEGVLTKAQFVSGCKNDPIIREIFDSNY